MIVLRERGREFFEREISNGAYYTQRFFETVIGIADSALAAKPRTVARA